MEDKSKFAMSLTDMSGQQMDMLSKRAAIFRSKLIADFHLLEMISEGGSRREVPNMYTHDITDTPKMRDMMMTRPQALVKFHIYPQKNKAVATSAARRRHRLKNRNKRNPPLDLWANWIVSSSWFQNFILALILINSVVLGIQAEYSGPDANKTVVLVLDIFDYCALLCFVVEIILKWLDNFKGFWKNRWNIFDFLVTFLSFVPEIIKYSGAGDQASDLTVVANNLRTFRVLRSLKMVSRFQKVRLIVLAVTKAFHAMVFIMVLMFIFAYIFAIVGVIFLDYSPYQEQLYYPDSFKSILAALITLFQLFTLDHWLEVFKDVRLVAGQGFAAMYVIVWIIIGSFIIRNIVVGIMVNNFQSIRNELFEEVGEIEQREKRDHEMAEFAEELDRQKDLRQGMSSNVLSEQSDDEDNKSSLKDEDISSREDLRSPSIEDTDLRPPMMPTKDTLSASMNSEEQSSYRGSEQRSASRYQSVEELQEAMEQNVSKAERDSEEWQAIVEKNLENLAKEEATFCWPQDSLFRYFLMLESLQENLQERQQLMHLACECLLLIQDC